MTDPTPIPLQNRMLRRLPIIAIAVAALVALI